MDELSRKVFHKEESELSEYERMMLGIIAEKQAAESAAEETPAEELPVQEAAEEVPAEEDTPAEAEDASSAEEAPAEEAAVEEAPAEEAAVEEAPAEETPVAESAAEDIPVAESAAEETPVEAAPADDTDDSDVKIAGEEPVQPKSERIPLLTEEKNPELEPVVLTRPTIQFKNSIEREKKITRKVQRHRRRSGLVVIGLCVALVFVAFLYNGIFNKSWGLLEKEEPTPVPEEELIAAESGEDILTAEPEPTPEPTPEPPPEHRYAVERADLSWIGAQDLCLASGGYLAVINDMDEFNRITALADEQGIEALWVGCHRDVNSNTMVWERGESVDKAVDPDERQMSLWAPGEPSFIDDEGTAEDYILLWNHDGGWRYWDSIGDLTIYFGWRGRIGYVCEFDS